MTRGNLRTLALTILIALSPVAARSQSNPPAATPPAAQNPAPPSSTAALSPSTSAPSESTPVKKVWTNDELAGAHNQPAASASQSARNANANPRQKTPAGPKARGDAQWYHDKIADLQAKLPPLDAQIAQLQAAIDGEPTGDAKTSTRPHFVKSGDWRQQQADLQKQRDDIATKINALQDEARHVGIPPNALP
jgi:hypothetical protein